MFALICILLPAGISVFLYQKLIPQKEISIKKYGGIYIAFAAGINTLNFIIVKYLFENNGNLIVLLNESKVFMLKYLCLACAFAFLLPILCWIDRADNLRGLLKLSEKKYDILLPFSILSPSCSFILSESLIIILWEMKRIPLA